MTDPDHRFSRQVRFAPFGAAGHERLRAARVAVVGLGGLGSTLADHVVRAGAGEVLLIDRDIVEESNLPRQTLYTDDDAARGLPKAEAAAQHLAQVAGATRLTPVATDVSQRTVDVLRGVDLVLDGLDNLETRFLLNDFCHREKIPWVYGGAVAGNGLVLSVGREGKPCLRCLFPEADRATLGDTCETAGVLSPLPSLVASLQVCEAFRRVAEPAAPARLWSLEPWHGRAFVAEPGASPSCPCCEHGKYPALELAGQPASARLCGRNTVQIVPGFDKEIQLDEVERRWAGLGAVRRTHFLVRLVLNAESISLFPDGRALVQGVETVERARALYSRYVGS